MSYIVYKHTSPSNKAYIGITSRSINKRANSNGSGYMGCPCFYNAINKYGWDNFKHEILESGLTKEEAEQEEIRLISLYDTTNPAKGYNTDNGGNCAGSHSPETRQKMSNSLKGKPLGRKATEETKQKHREFFLEHNPQKGKPIPLKQKEYQSKVMKGRYAGNKHPRAKAVRCITTGQIYDTVKEAGKDVGVSYMNIIQSIQENHRRKTAGNINGVPLKWKYVN